MIERGIDLLQNPDTNNATPIVGTCAICGRPLTQVGPKGECLRCLADLGFSSTSQEPGKPKSGRRLTPGSLKYDHFEVEIGADGFPIELGAGAVAITYRARDTVLNSLVALKVIDRKVAAMPGVRSRFLREARAAAQIRHPNVARVSHYGEQDGECFYVMQLVEGETLEAKVRREGPISLAVALEIIEQTVRALAAAEKCGVVHRDIKPSNIMLESDPSGLMIVKVIDYGIAKVLHPEAEIGAEQTQPGFIGTPAFASPEQFAPGDGETRVDTRSDIYSLGATLWYLLTGRVPFLAGSMEAIRAKQEKGLPVEELKTLHVPTQVVSLLKSMLAPDPKDRPQSARELLARVHRCYTKFGSEARERRRHSELVAGGVVLVLIAIGLGALLYQRAQSSAQMERSIAVLPFENLSPNGEDTYFTVGMQDEITGDLARLAGMRVIGAQSTRSYPPGKPRNLPSIARELGVRHLLEGAVSRESGAMRVSLKLVDTRDSDHPWTEGYERPAKDVFAMQSEITRAIAARLQTRVSSRETAALDLPPTADLRAYDLFLQARAIHFPSTEFWEGEFADGKRAIELLDEALSRDPNFVPAYCLLARWHDELHFAQLWGPVEERSVNHRGMAEAALEKARRVRPESGLVHLGLAIHALQINRDADEAEIQIQLARQTLPNDAQVESIAGRVSRRQDRWDEAVRNFERAISLEPRDFGLCSLLAGTYRSLRRYQDYERVVGKMISLLPPKGVGVLSINRAEAELERSADTTQVQVALAAAPLSDRLFGALYTRNTAELDRLLSMPHDAAFGNGITYPDAWFRALTARIRGDNRSAVTQFAMVRPAIEKIASADPTNGVPLSILAIIDAGLGRNEAALTEARHACDLTTFKTNSLAAPTVRCNLAVVYAWAGQKDLAIAELSKLIDRPASFDTLCQPSYGDFRLNPFWDPLRSDPRFEALVQRLAPVATK